MTRLSMKLPVRRNSDFASKFSLPDLDLPRQSTNPLMSAKIWMIHDGILYSLFDVPAAIVESMYKIEVRKTTLAQRETLVWYVVLTAGITEAPSSGRQMLPSFSPHDRAATAISSAFVAS